MDDFPLWRQIAHKRQNTPPLVLLLPWLLSSVRRMAAPERRSSGDDPAPVIPWNQIAMRPDFIALVKAKMAFIIPTTIFFLIYYLALPAMVGWYPDLMTTKVWGAVNVAYLFALSQFFMAWIVAALYVRVAAGWDKRARDIASEYESQEPVK
jgi:uncharacterized membrane protein (DUF485 family)